MCDRAKGDAAREHTAVSHVMSFLSSCTLHRLKKFCLIAGEPEEHGGDGREDAEVQAP